jgi:hypothetical protein
MKNLYNKQTGVVSWFLAIPVGLVVLPIILICWWYLGSFYCGITWSIMCWIYDVMISLGFVFPWGWIWGVTLVLVQLCSAFVLPAFTFIFAISFIFKILNR